MLLPALMFADVKCHAPKGPAVAMRNRAISMNRQWLQRTGVVRTVLDEFQFYRSGTRAAICNTIYGGALLDLRYWASISSPDTSTSMMLSGKSDGQGKKDIHGRVQA